MAEAPKSEAAMAEAHKSEAPKSEAPEAEAPKAEPPMADLEVAICMIMDVFARYAGTRGSRQSLSKEELRALLQKELPGLLEGGKEGALDKLFQGLHTGEDATVSFQEFIVLVAGLMSACHKHFQED